MPLKKSTSNKAFNQNMEKELKSGKKISQATAIALSVAKKAKGKKK